MSYNINIPDADWSTQVITLGGTTFNLELKYKERTQRWYMTLSDIDGNPLVTEKKIVDGQSLTGLWDIEGLFGDIWCERVYGLDVYPTRDTLGIGKAFNLVYFTEDELDWILRLEDNNRYINNG